MIGDPSERAESASSGNIDCRSGLPLPPTLVECSRRTRGLTVDELTSAVDASAENRWLSFLEDCSDRRCDLEILLRDAFRHRVPFRDGPERFGSYDFRDIPSDVLWSGGGVRPSYEYAKAEIVLAFHLLLDAYGFGTATAIAVVDATEASSLEEAEIRPTVVEHSDLWRTRRSEFAADLRRVLGDHQSALPSQAILGRGLFDLTVVFTRDDTYQTPYAGPVTALFRFDEAAGLVVGRIVYSKTLIDLAIVEGLIALLEVILRQLREEPDALIKDLVFLSDAERHTLHEFSATDGDFPTQVRLEDLLGTAAQRTPAAIALRTDELALTYDQLNKRANRFARCLASEVIGTESGQFVGLFLDRGLLPVVATIALWKVGATCVPIDPTQPVERVATILKETGTSLLIANERHAGALRQAFVQHAMTIRVVSAEAISENAADCSGEELGLRFDNAQAAYVMYTSGTTGVPKCVAKSHVSVVNSITDLSERYGMTAAPGEERIVLFSGCGFEPFMRQLLLALINSQILVLVPDDIRLDPHRFPDFLDRQSVTHLNGTGSVIRNFDLARCPNLRRIALVGEELTTAGLRELRKVFAGPVINEYAFTEATFVTAIKTFDRGETERADRSIGRPLRNVRWYVLDKHRRQLPIGAIGELYVGGRGIADGYINNDALSAERFHVDPYVAIKSTLRTGNGLIYATGDLARLLPNGEVEFLGRRDFQMKINGIRIEPGEIESRAAEFPGIRRCVVVPNNFPIDSGRSSLVGFYTTVPGAEVDDANLVAFLKARLVPVMVPSRMLKLDAFPVTAIGKVDWRALMEMVRERPLSTRAPALVMTPQVSSGSTERILRDKWSDVLNVASDEIDATADFFRLGGDSIASIQLIARIRERLGRGIRVNEVAEHALFGDFAAFVGGQPVESPSSTATRPSRGSLAREGAERPAYGLQQGLLYHALNTVQGDDTYVMQTVHLYHTAIRPDLMELAWRRAYARFPALDLRFVAGERPFQRLDGHPASMDWIVVDFGDCASRPNAAAEFEFFCNHQRREPFDFEKGPLFRLRFVHRGADGDALVFTCHHILLDGWSLSILHEAVHSTYLALLEGRLIDEPADEAFLAAQAYWAEHRDDHVDYWAAELKRIEQSCDLRGLLKLDQRGKIDLRSYNRIRRHEKRSLTVTAETYIALRTACASRSLTIHSALQFAWHIALRAFGGGKQTVIGTIASGRAIPVLGIETAVGLFINTLPIIFEHDFDKAGQTVAEAMAEIQRSTNFLNARSTVNLAEIGTSGPKGRLFDALLMFENYPVTEDDRRHRDALAFDRLRDVDKVDHPLQIVGRQANDSLEIDLWYAGELFDDAMIAILLKTVSTIFDQIAGDLTRTIGEIALVDDGELALFDRWNATDQDFSKGSTLIDVFEEVAAKWPEERALVFRQVELSYRELDERADLLAQLMVSQIRPEADDLIAIMMDKSDWMIASILAVWKIGAAYVPIDPSYPTRRIAFILDDTAARLMVTDPAYRDRLEMLRRAGETSTPFEIFVPQDAPLYNQTKFKSRRMTVGNDLAYAIYTSGTTGQPKAVLVEHRGVVNLRESLARTFGLERSQGRQTFLSFSNVVFDHFVEQMTDALLNGQTLVVLDDDLRADNEALRECIRAHGVTYLSGTPSVLSIYDLSDCPSIRIVDAIGEDLTRPAFEAIRRWFGGTIVNGYGPTEISITSHKRPYGSSESRQDKSIGLPVANTRCYILDDLMRRIPIGGIGELYIGGTGVARGYLNRESLTAERFVSDPFARRELGGAPSQLYRTGDVCRWLPNGEIEYLGRVDSQVKINGHRIEPGEIESAILAHPDVQRAVVVAREQAVGQGVESGRRFLAAFYLASAEIAPSEMATWLRDRLPTGLMPAQIKRIDHVPVTPSGKLDVAALPPSDLDEETTCARPTTPLEQALHGIWARILAVPLDRIAMSDDFFAVGGDSLRAMKLAMTVTAELSLRLTLPAIFEFSTIKAQARHLADRMCESSSGVASQASSGGSDPPITPAQERLVFIDELLGGTSAYNIPLVFTVDLRHVSVEMVKKALQLLVQRHASLRTLIVGDVEGGRVLKVLYPDVALLMLDLSLNRMKIRRDLDERLHAAEGHVFRLDGELPVRMDLLTLADEPATLYVDLVFHHSCFDGWSMEIFRREFVRLITERNFTISSSDATYADYAVLQREGRSEAAQARSIELLRERLKGLSTLDLPLDKPRPALFDYRGFETMFAIDFETTCGLRALARSCGVSLYTVLLAASSLVLESYSGQKDFAVGTPTANRLERRFDDVIGLFANLVVMRIEVDRSQTVANYLRAVGAQVNDALRCQDVPFDHVVKALDIEPDHSRHPLFQAVVTLVALGVDGGITTLMDYKPEANGRTSAKFDLSFAFVETAREVTGNVTIPLALFERESAEAFVRTFETIAGEMALLSAKADTATVGGLRRSDRTDRELSEMTPILATARTTALELDATDFGSLAHLFERVAAQNRQRLAVICGDRRLTYDELNRAANRLAARLTVAGAKPGERSAIVMRASEQTIIAILAIWKTAGSYVPLDPDYPDERTAFVLQDAGVSRVLTDHLHAQRLWRLSGDRIVVVDQIPVSNEGLDDDPDLDIQRDCEAYVIYTSGTSGKPKGVVVEHGNVLSFHEGLAERVFGAESERHQTLLLTSNIVFDFSIEQLCLSIMSGHSLLIEPEQVLDDDMYQRLNAHRLTYLSGTPTQIDRFDLSRLRFLETVLIAGEAIRPHHFGKIRATFSGRLLTAYGTTETTVYNTVRQFAPTDDFANDLGSPLPNTRLAILDSSLRPVPNGARGQLFICGPCVTVGYLNCSDLDASRFRQGGEHSDDGVAGDSERVYATGDFVRRHPKGHLEFHGRNDKQVKINGFRIELGEVEAVLAAHPAVKQCAVITHLSADGRWELVAYYVPEETGDWPEGIPRKATAVNLVEDLGRFLPRAMLPSHVVAVSGSLPITINGKLDVAALPAPGAYRTAERYAAPRNRRETELCDAFSEVLGSDRIGIDDDFFRTGGDSIGALHLAAHLRRIVGAEANVRWVFDHPTVRRLSVFADQHSETYVSDLLERVDFPVMLPGQRMRATPIQEWFFSKQLSWQSFWNQEFAIQTSDLDVARLRTALQRLARLHDAFSLRFDVSHQGKPVTMTLRPDSSASIELKELNVGATDPQTVRDLLDTWQSGFDVSTGNLATAAYLHGYADGTARIWFAFHHLIVDRVSWTIILRDLEILYYGGDLNLENLGYSQWASLLRLYNPKPEEAALWREVASDVADDLRSRHALRREDATKSKRLRVSPIQLARLRSLTDRVGGPEIRDLLLAAVGHAARDLDDLPSRYVTVENHGREPFDPRWQIGGTVGWFTSLHPVRVDLAGDPIGTAWRLKAWRARVPHNGLGYGLSLGPLGSQVAPLPPISFNYLGRIAASYGRPASPSKARWQLDPEMFGLRKSAADRGTSSGTLDVTAWIAKDELVFAIDSGLGQVETDRFSDRLIDSISDMCDASAAPVIAKEDGTPRSEARQDRLRGFDPVVLVEKAPEAPDLFLLPPGEGGAESYLGNLSRHLGPINQILFNNVHLHGRYSNLEEICDHYLTQIRKRRQSGTYNLLGWSFGGVVALEIARRLACEGGRIQNLILIDPFWRLEMAAQLLQLKDVSVVVDPINLGNLPSREDFEPLLRTVGRITLFKARACHQTPEVERRRLFEYYAKSFYNHLDTLIPANAIRIRSLGSCDHFSWVHDEVLVAEMGREICDLLRYHERASPR